MPRGRGFRAATGVVALRVAVRAMSRTSAISLEAEPACRTFTNGSVLGESRGAVDDQHVPIALGRDRLVGLERGRRQPGTEAIEHRHGQVGEQRLPAQQLHFNVVVREPHVEAVQ